ncbi:hypothetical protein [Marinobacter sp. S6332]|uniref:hypothetical protein n=1 Tax=Marinobacter sp. S6332 TaxID=2926403 RepID=UPI001FF322A4|nr:hypothetical protein [Marinobacter sp. S6332]MCK0162746.1 hypothetical protein [Marinobacter sp. S6332]
MSTLLPALIGLGSAKMSMIDTTFSTNAPLMREMVTNHENYKAGEKAKGLQRCFVYPEARVSHPQ